MMTTPTPSLEPPPGIPSQAVELRTKRWRAQVPLAMVTAVAATLAARFYADEMKLDDLRRRVELIEQRKPCTEKP